MSCKQEINFQTIFPNGSCFKPALDELILSGKIDNFRLKSAIWKFYLNIFPQTKQTCVTVQEWMNIIQTNRDLYNEIKNKYLVNTTLFESRASFDPLSRNENSRWDQYFKDDAQMKEIIKDTNRLFQEYEFFHDPEILERINQIILLHLRHNQLEYKQGYHELCGVIFYLFSNEMKSKLSKATDPSYPYNFLFSKSSVDADVFWAYSSLITFMIPFYQIPNDKSSPFFVQIANHLVENVLKSVDPDLSDAICVPDVAVPIIPWFRLLFSRLFPIDDISKVWTVIIRFYPDMNIIVAIALSIILSYKDKFILCEDQTSVMVTLMNVHVDFNCDEILKQSVRYYRNILKGLKLETSGKENRFIQLIEPICKEIQTDIYHITTLPKDQLILKLAKFRDSLNIVVTTEENEEILKGGNDVDLLQSLPPNLSSLNNKKLPSTFDIEIPFIVQDSIMALPKASAELTDQDCVDLMEENDEHQKQPKRLELITKNENLFE